LYLGEVKASDLGAIMHNEFLLAFARFSQDGDETVFGDLLEIETRNEELSIR